MRIRGKKRNVFIDIYSLNSSLPSLVCVLLQLFKHLIIIYFINVSAHPPSSVNITIMYYLFRIKIFENIS